MLPAVACMSQMGVQSAAGPCSGPLGSWGVQALWHHLPPEGAGMGADGKLGQTAEDEGRQGRKAGLGSFLL